MKLLAYTAVLDINETVLNEVELKKSFEN